jgi:hypothetical protein
VCQNSYRSSILLIPRCSSCPVYSRNNICDSCLHKYIFTKISQDITSQIICHEQGCNSKLTNATIQAALDAFNHHDLWEEYTLKSKWRGTSKQWIERFAARCPSCLVPIEKNGGCNQVVCRQCHRVFNWEQAKNPNLYQIRSRWRTLSTLVQALFFIFLTMILMFFVVKLFIAHKEKLMSVIDNLLMCLTYFSTVHLIVV